MNKLVTVIAVLVASTACSKKKEQAPAASPAAGSAAETATGSAAGSATGSVAGSASGSAAGSAADSGSGAATGSAAAADGLVITEKGLGAIVAVTGGKDDDRLAVMKKAFAAYPELSVDDDVMDMGGEVEHEEGYTSVKKGETEVLQIFDTEGGYEVHAVDPMITTADGLKQGDLVSAAAEKRKDLTCTADKASQVGLLTCTSAAEPHLTFVVDAENYKGATKGTVDVSKIATRKIVEIVR